MRIYFARHGESEANVQEIFWNRPAGYGLTDTGRAQARALRGTLSDIPFAARFMPFIARLVASYSATQDNVLLISHGGLLVTMLPKVLTDVDAATALRWGCPYASPIVAERQDDEWVCLRWGDRVL